MNSEQNKIVGSGSASPIGPTRSEQDGPVTMSPATANGVVIHEVSSWEGVSVCEHRRGGVEFRLGRRELGHLHADDSSARRPTRWNSSRPSSASRRRMPSDSAGCVTWRASAARVKPPCSTTPTTYSICRISIGQAYGTYQNDLLDLWLGWRSNQVMARVPICLPK